MGIILKERIINEIRQLGTVKDESDMIPISVQETIPYRFTLLEETYKEVSDSSLTVLVYARGFFSVTNRNYPFRIISNEDTKLFKEKFKDTGFGFEESKVYGGLCVMGHANCLHDLRQLILEYKQAREAYLENKIVQREGEDGQSYLFRKDSKPIEMTLSVPQWVQKNIEKFDINISQLLMDMVVKEVSREFYIDKE